MHGVGQVLYILQFFYRDIPSRGIEHGGNAVHNRSASMFHGSWFLHKERGIRFPDDLPVAHIAVIGPIHFANALGFNHRSLEGFCGYYRAHANAMTLGDDPAQRGGIQVGIVKIRYTFLGLGFNGPSHFIAQGFVGIPHIGGFQRGGDAQFFLQILPASPCPQRFGQSEP